MVKCLPTIQETRVRFLGQEDPLEKEMAIHSSTLAWKIPWRRSLIGYSSWGRKELDTTERLHSLKQPKGQRNHSNEYVIPVVIIWHSPKWDNRIDNVAQNQDNLSNVAKVQEVLD